MQFLKSISQGNAEMRLGCDKIFNDIQVKEI